jgi:hypothetical protein
VKTCRTRGVSFALLLCGGLLVHGIACTTRLSTAPVISQPSTTTTILFVRHAERDEGLDPPLNAEGLARAQALLSALGENGVTAIYSPDLHRNLQTAQPLADMVGLKVNLIPDAALLDTRAFANQFVDEILAFHAGGVVLFVGNIGPVIGEQSGNLQETYWRLGGTGDPPVRYQDMYAAVITETADVHFIKATYGGPSSLD